LIGVAVLQVPPELFERVCTAINDARYRASQIVPAQLLGDRAQVIGRRIHLLSRCGRAPIDLAAYKVLRLSIHRGGYLPPQPKRQTSGPSEGVGMRLSLAAMAALLASGITAEPAGAARAVNPPYLKLAQMLGTPQLARAVQPRDKSRLLLEFVRPGESTSHWTKMTTVSIAVVPRPETQAAAYGIIDRFHHTLAQRHAHIGTFDLRPVKPYSVFFTFEANGERDQGIAYSPALGFVTIAQVAEKKAGLISRNDTKVLRSLIGR